MDLNTIIAALRAKWEKYDPKMKYQLLSGVVTYVLLKLAVPVDPILEGLISLGVGGLVGYAVPNAASNAAPVVPEDAAAEEDDIPDAGELDGTMDPLAGIDVEKLAARETPKARSKRGGVRRVAEGEEFPPLK